MSEDQKTPLPNPINNLQYQCIIDNPIVGLWFLDAQGKVTFVNQRVANMLGTATDQIIGTNPLEFIHEDDRTNVIQHLSQRKQGVNEVYEVRFRRKDNGEILYAFVSAAAIIDNNKFMGNVAQCIDITQYKKEQTALLENSKRYQALIEQASDGILVLDTKGNIISVNEAFAQMHGLTIDEVMKHGLIHGLDVDINEEGMREKMGQIMAGKAISFEVRHWHKNGRIIPILVTSNLIFSAGKPMLMALHHDLTEQKEREEEIRLQAEIAKNLSEGITLVKSDDSTIVYSNPKFEQMFGYETGEMTGKHISILNAPTEKPPEETTSIIVEALTTKGKWHGEIERIKKDGTRFWTYTSVSVFNHSKYGKVAIGIYNDITERKKAQEERREMLKLLHTSKLASMGMLAAGVAHEINNPLAVIKGNISLMQGNVDEKTAKMLEKQNKAVDRISQIVKSLNTYARVDEEAMGNIDIHQNINETLALLGPLFKKEHIEFDCRLNAPQTVLYTNSGYFQQIFMNLLTNARDAFTEKKVGNKIIIESKCEAGRIEVRVTDNGCGMSPQVLAKIFDPFFTTKPPGKGTGIGLSISQSCIASMNGTINVTSEVGVGTVFTVSLPLMADPRASASSKAASQEKKRFSGRVLLVDDDDDVREILKEHMQKLGLDVIEANDGDVALNILKKDTDIQFLVTDIKMDKMNGDELIKSIRECGCAKQTKIIIVSGGFTTDDAKEQSKGLRSLVNDKGGADDFFAKPFSHEDIAAAFTRVSAMGRNKR